MIQKIQHKVFLATIILALFFGALSPVFRADEMSKYVGVFSVFVMTIIIMINIFRTSKKS